MLNATGFKAGSPGIRRSYHSRIYEDSSSLGLVCRQLSYEISPFIGSYIHLTLRTLKCNGDFDNYDYIMSIPSMLPEKNRKSLKSIIVYSHKHKCDCDIPHYLAGLLDNREKYPALLRVDACCENTKYYEPGAPYSSWKYSTIGLEICVRFEHHGSSRVWKLAASDGGWWWAEWREETQLKHGRQRLRIKKLLHKLLCARAD